MRGVCCDEAVKAAAIVEEKMLPANAHQCAGDAWVARHTVTRSASDGSVHILQRDAAHRTVGVYRALPTLREVYTGDDLRADLRGRIASWLDCREGKQTQSNEAKGC